MERGRIEAAEVVVALHKVATVLTPCRCCYVRYSEIESFTLAGCEHANERVSTAVR